MSDDDLMFKPMDGIPTRRITRGEAKKELAEIAERVAAQLEQTKDAGRVSQSVMDLEFTV